jgi:CDP-diacylglycerol--glycerol-3-phosphate 3-phosphatidyltransferase
VSPADQLTVARVASVPVVVLLFAWPFHQHAYWATAAFCVAMATDWFDGRLARRHGRTSPLGSLLDPIADKVLVLAAIERGVVLAARDLGKLKTWAQAIAAGLGGFAAAGAWSDRVAWWSLLVAVVLTWVSGLDYARSAPAMFTAAGSRSAVPR